MEEEEIFMQVQGQVILWQKQFCWVSTGQVGIELLFHGSIGD